MPNERACDCASCMEAERYRQSLDMAAGAGVGEEVSVDEVIPTPTPTPDPELVCEQCATTDPTNTHTVQVWEREYYRPQETTKRLCEECVDDQTYTCDDCGDRVWRRNLRYGGDTGRYVEGVGEVCPTCVEENYFTCERCSDIAPRDEMNGVIDRYGDEVVVCDGCSNYYTYCEECGQSYEDNAYHDSDVHSCMGGGQYVHNYSYRPEFLYHSKDGVQLRPVVLKGKHTLPYLGFELEVEVGDATLRDAAKQVSETAGDIAYLKDDSTINSGFEFVTHPFHWEWGHDGFPWQAIQVMADLGMETHNGVGMHVHISRRAFTPSHLWRFLQFQYGNDRRVVTLAGRENVQWASWDKPDGWTMLGYAQGPDGTFLHRRMRENRARWVRAAAESFDNYSALRVNLNRNTDSREYDWASRRYAAINTSNTDTLELRYFASSVDVDEVKARLAFVHSVWDYTRHLSSVECKKDPDLLSWAQYAMWLEEQPHRYYQPLQSLLTREHIDLDGELEAVTRERDELAQRAARLDEFLTGARARRQVQVRPGQFY